MYFDNDEDFFCRFVAHRVDHFFIRFVNTRPCGRKQLVPKFRQIERQGYQFKRKHIVAACFRNLGRFPFLPQSRRLYLLIETAPKEAVENVIKKRNCLLEVQTSDWKTVQG
jgi:hypothetical protein